MSGNHEAFQLAMNEGHSAAWDQMWEQAAQFYQKALKEFPDHPNALTSLGLALFEMQDFEQALKCYLAASKNAPEDPLPVDKIGRIFERQGRLPEAVQSYLKAADLYLKIKDVEKAIECWVRLITLQPDHLMARTRLAMIYERMGRKPKAVEEYLATASLMQHNGEVNRAIQVAEYCLRIDPNNGQAKDVLARLRNNQPLPKPKRPHGATGPVRMAEVRKMEDIQGPKTTAQDPIVEARQKALIQMASLLFDQAEGTKPKEVTARRGIATLTRGTGNLQLNPENDVRIGLHLGQAIDAQTQGNDQQALRELESALDLGLTHPSAFFNAGAILAEKDQAKALRYLQKAYQHPDYALASHLLMAKIHEKKGEYREAASSYLSAFSYADAALVPAEQAEELRQMYEPIIETQSHQTDTAALKSVCENISNQLHRSDWRQYLWGARQQMSTQGDGGPLVPLFEVLLESGSSRVVDSLTRVRQLANQNLYYAAMEEIFQTLEYAPTYLLLHIQIGELLLQQGRTQDAVSKFLIVADLYNLRGEGTQAVRLLTRVTQMAPMDLKVRNRLIDILANQGKVREAIQECVKLAEVHYQMAELGKAREVYSSALRMAQQAKIERSLSVQLLYKIADIDLQRLDMRQAVRVFEQIRTLEPEDIEARLKLIDLDFRLAQDSPALSEVDGYVSLVENSGKRSKAIEFLKRAINEQPAKLELHKRLADVYVRDGKTVEAVEQFDMIADALLNANNQRGAIMILKTIIALNPPNVTDYQDALTQLQNSR
jgi:tetratricopeptide (TPR) repeat protein